MNTSAELSVREIRAALDAGPTDGPWAFAIIDECTPSTNHEPLAYWIDGCGPRRFVYDKNWFLAHLDAKYIAACNPANMRKVLALLQSQEDEIARLRETGEKLVKATNYRQAILTAADFDAGRKVFADETYWRAFDAFCDALSPTKPNEGA